MCIYEYVCMYVCIYGWMEVVTDTLVIRTSFLPPIMGILVVIGISGPFDSELELSLCQPIVSHRLQLQLITVSYHGHIVF